MIYDRSYFSNFSIFKGSPTEIPREPCRKEYHVLPFPQVLFPFPRPKLEYGLEFAFVTLRKIYKKTVLPLRTYTCRYLLKHKIRSNICNTYFTTFHQIKIYKKYIY